MARWKVDDELRGDQPASTFEPFKNGKLNPKTPKFYNWLTGFSDCPRGDGMKRKPTYLETRSAKLNGKHLVPC